MGFHPIQNFDVELGLYIGKGPNFAVFGYRARISPLDEKKFEMVAHVRGNTPKELGSRLHAALHGAGYHSGKVAYHQFPTDRQKHTPHIVPATQEELAEIVSAIYNARNPTEAS
jgi:hypothetical protein